MSVNRPSNPHSGATEQTPLLATAITNEAQETELTGTLGSSKPASPGRQVALDLLRGLLMVLMAMDHTSVTTNAYVHGTGMMSEGATKVVTQWNNNLPYIMRTATHLCAAGFAMLLGVGISFVTEGRLAQGMKVSELARHFLLRAFAIFIVSIFAFLPVLVRPPYEYLNAVLLALAIDYLIVGFSYLFIVSTAELYLIKTIKKLMPSKRNATGPTSTASQDEEALAKVIAFYSVNAFFLLASALTLWTNIWTSPNLGECRTATTQFEGGISPRCHLNRHFLFDLFFGLASCPNLHIESAFPPMGWLSFALFGVLYGRILIHGNFKTTSKVIVFNICLSLILALLFVSTRLLSYGNLTTHCLATPDQAYDHLPCSSSHNQYLASFKSFFYIVKYPPSPAFAFFTLSACFMLIALFAALSTSLAFMSSPWNPLIVFGVQPLFFYATHISVLWILSIPLLQSSLAHYKPGGRPGRDRGIDLGWSFVALWAAVLAIEYIACMQYSKFKLRRGRESIWRFL